MSQKVIPTSLEQCPNNRDDKESSSSVDTMPKRIKEKQPEERRILPERNVRIAARDARKLVPPPSKSSAKFPNKLSDSSSTGGEHSDKTRKPRARKRSIEVAEDSINELADNLSTLNFKNFDPMGLEDSSSDEDESPPPDRFLMCETNAQASPIVPDNPTGDYEVERILLIRKIGDVLYYLLKWKNYPLYQMSWARRKDLHTCDKVLKDFEARVTVCRKIYDLLPNKNEYNGFIDYYDTSIITPSFNEQNLFESTLVPFMVKNEFGPLYIENWTQMCDVLPESFGWISKCLYSYPASLEMKKFVDDKSNPLPVCECKNCDPKTCPCLKSKITSYGSIRSDFSNYIYECNKNCGCCSSKCPSKIFRNGRKIPVMLFRTPKCGWSVRTMERIPRLRFVMEYVGLVKIYEECENAPDETYLFNCNLPDSSIKFVIDATDYGNESRFINHHCNPNLEVSSVLGYYSNPNLTRLVFFSNRDIEAGEELTFNYFPHELNLEGIDPKEKRICRCGAVNCRKYLF